MATPYLLIIVFQNLLETYLGPYQTICIKAFFAEIVIVNKYNPLTISAKRASTSTFDMVLNPPLSALNPPLSAH